MKFIISNKITLVGVPYHLEAELRQMFTLDNPIYGDAEKRGRCNELQFRQNNGWVPDAGG